MFQLMLTFNRMQVSDTFYNITNERSRIQSGSTDWTSAKLVCSDFPPSPSSASILKQLEASRKHLDNADNGE